MRASQRPDAAISSSERLGRYDLLLPIASGGMATVYLARTRGFGGFERDVAIKLMHPHLREHDEFAVDLIEEAKLCALIRHPNVVPVLDVANDRMGVYLVMEYVEGTSLSGLIKAGRATNDPLPVPIALRILLDMLAGLHAAHELADESGRPIGLVHRDVSPQNVLVGLDGVGRLTDFGIAKAATRISHTRTGTTKGKLAYMAPEQANAQALDRRCDVWAAGVMAWELIAGRRLFSGNEASIVLDVVSGKVPPLSEARPDVPDALAEAVESALSVPVHARCPTAASLRDRIARACSGDYALAEPAAVAEYVARVCGAQLESRRERARGIAAQRGPMSSGSDDALELLTAADPSWLVLEADAPAATTPLTSAAANEPLSTTPLSPGSRAAPRVWPAALVALAIAGLAAIVIARAMTDPVGESSAASSAAPGVAPAAPVASEARSPAPQPASAPAETSKPATAAAAPATRAPKPSSSPRRTASPQGAGPFTNPYKN